MANVNLQELGLPEAQEVEGVDKLYEVISRAIAQRRGEGGKGKLRALVIYGQTGVGKTAIATYVTRQSGGTVPWVVPVSSLQTLESGVPQISASGVTTLMPTCIFPTSTVVEIAKQVGLGLNMIEKLLMTEGDKERVEGLLEELGGKLAGAILNMTSSPTGREIAENLGREGFGINAKDNAEILKGKYKEGGLSAVLPSLVYGITYGSLGGRLEEGFRKLKRKAEREGWGNRRLPLANAISALMGICLAGREVAKKYFDETSFQRALDVIDELKLPTGVGASWGEALGVILSALVAGAEPEIVLILDEFNRNPDLLAAISGIFSERKVGQEPISDSVVLVIGTANPPTYRGAERLEEHVIQRTESVLFTINNEEWVEWASGRPDLFHPLVILFLQAFPTYVMPPVTSSEGAPGEIELMREGKGFPSPRNWESVSKELHSLFAAYLDSQPVVAEVDRELKKGDDEERYWLRVTKHFGGVIKAMSESVNKGGYDSLERFHRAMHLLALYTRLLRKFIRSEKPSEDRLDDIYRSWHKVLYQYVSEGDRDLLVDAAESFYEQIGEEIDRDALEQAVRDVIRQGDSLANRLRSLFFEATQDVTGQTYYTVADDKWELLKQFLGGTLAVGAERSELASAIRGKLTALVGSATAESFCNFLTVYSDFPPVQDMLSHPMLIPIAMGLISEEGHDIKSLAEMLVSLPPGKDLPKLMWGAELGAEGEAIKRNSHLRSLVSGFLIRSWTEDAIRQNDVDSVTRASGHIARLVCATRSLREKQRGGRVAGISVDKDIVDNLFTLSMSVAGTEKHGVVPFEVTSEDDLGGGKLVKSEKYKDSQSPHLVISRGAIERLIHGVIWSPEDGSIGKGRKVVAKITQALAQSNIPREAVSHNESIMRGAVSQVGKLRHNHTLVRDLPTLPVAAMGREDLFVAVVRGLVGALAQWIGTNTDVKTEGGRGKQKWLKGTEAADGTIDWSMPEGSIQDPGIALDEKGLEEITSDPEFRRIAMRAVLREMGEALKYIK